MVLFKKNKQKTATPAVQRKFHPIKAIASKGRIIGRVLLVLLVLVVCVFPALFVNNAIAYIPLISVVLLVVVSFVYLQILIRSLEYSEASLLDSCERGSQIEFVVNFVNKSPLIFTRLEPSIYISDLFGEDDSIFTTSMVLKPFEKRDFKFDAEFEHLGTYSAGVRRIVISDLLGLFSHTIENPNQHEVQVLPKLFDVSRVDLSNVSVQESRSTFQPIVTDDMDYAGVREYAPGDPLKTIHWKLSARTATGDYFTRLFETFGNPGISIIIDNSAPAYDRESLMQIFDGVVESALSVNDHAHKCGIDSELMYIDRDGESAKMRLFDLRDSKDLVEAMPRINISEGREAQELLMREGNSIHGQGNVAFCTSQLNEQVISTLIEIKLRQRNPLLFTVVPSVFDEEQRREFLRPLARLEAAGIVYYLVSPSSDKLSQEVM